MLEDAYNKGRDAKEQAKSDLQTGRERAEDKLDSSGSSTPGSYSATSTQPAPTTPTAFPSNRI